MITDEMRTTMAAINANLSHTRFGKSCAKYLRYQDGEVVEFDRPNTVAANSMFPYRSTAMAVDPEEVPGVQEHLKRHGLFVEFDEEGRPEITSTKQQDALAKAMGMKTGRDGYGHTDEFGNFQNSGRRRTAEMQSGRGRIRKAIQELRSMPEDAPAHVVAGVLDQYDIRPTDENTG